MTSSGGLSIILDLDKWDKISFSFLVGNAPAQMLPSRHIVLFSGCIMDLT